MRVSWASSTWTFLVVFAIEVTAGDGDSCTFPRAPFHRTTSCSQEVVCREISYVLLAVSGTLEEGFELRKNMDYRPFGDDGPGRVNATFLGKALVRGYKSFLDIKDPGWREYKDDSDLKTVNPALVPTGCDEHANRYAIYAVDSRQAINALAGEPRFLSIAPDMGLVDLTAADDLTFPDIKALSVAYARDMSLSGVAEPALDRIAFITVTSTWLKSSFVPNGIIRQDQDGIITDYPVSTGIWSNSILNKNGTTHDTYPQGCGSFPTGGQVSNVDSAADYNTCIDAAIRFQEAEYEVLEGEQVGGFASFENCIAGKKECFDCQRPARYGTDKNVARFNRVLTACELENIMVAAGLTDENGGPKFKLQGCSQGFPPFPKAESPAKLKRKATSLLSATVPVVYSIISAVLGVIVGWLYMQKELKMEQGTT